MAAGNVVVVGGTQGLGRELAQVYADEGRDVIVTGRDPSRAETAADEIGGATRGIGFDLAEPHTIADALADVGRVDHLVLVAIERDVNKVREYDLDAALRLVTLKLVGYTEVIHVLRRACTTAPHPVLRRAGARSVRTRARPPCTTVNGGVTALVRTLVVGARADPRQRHPPGDRR